MSHEDRGGDYYPMMDDPEDRNFIQAKYPNSTGHMSSVGGNHTMSSFDDNHGIEMLRDDEHSLLHESPVPIPAIHNLDSFLTDVYNYFRGKGFMCIFFNDLFELVSSLFVVLFFTFLVCFVDYSKLFSEQMPPPALRESVNFSAPIPIWLMVFLVIFSLYWLSKLFSFFSSIKTNWEISSFYKNTLKVNEDDIQTIEWREVVSKIVLVPRLCIVKENMNALDIANRIMRKENYIIGLINQRILNLSIPFPFLRNLTFITKTLEWSLMYSLFNYIFDENGIIKSEFQDPTQRKRLSRGLSRRFLTIGILGLFTTPFIFFFLLINFFFEYAEELKNRPGSLFSREWSPLARWEFRELNELPHYFQNRLSLSYSHANQYVESFPSQMLSTIAKFISFLFGSVLAVFIVMGIVSDHFIMNYQIFDRTPIWYIGILGTIVAITRSLIVDENQVFQPAKHMARTVQNTHYLPMSWVGKTHTHKVRDEFLVLFEYRIVDFVRDIFSVLFTPFILIFSLPKSSQAIIDFFGNNTVVLEGVGPICQLGDFSNIRKLGDNSFGSLNHSQNKISLTNNAKLEKSIINFKCLNPEWNTDNNELLQDLNEFSKIKNNNNNNNNNNGSNNHIGNHSQLPTTSVDDFQFIHDSHYIPHEIIDAVLGTHRHSQQSNNNAPRFKTGRVDQNILNAVNDLHQSFYESQYKHKNDNFVNSI
ncbi:hypothetical protein ACTFIZ_001440 [Dictyostelium cf. discoideum]